MANVVYLNKSLSYVDFNPQYNQAKDRFYLSIQFFVKKYLRIESNILQSMKTPRISIISSTLVLTLTSSHNKEKKEIIMRLPTDADPLQLNISLGSNLTFYKRIDRLELENLLEWRKGGDVTLSWLFYGNGLTGINGHTILSALAYDSNLSFTPPHISQNKWDFIVRNCRLDDKYIIEHSLSIPENLHQKKNQFLKQVLYDVTTMSTNLNNAKDRIRKANNTSDYKAVMGDVKSSLDSIRNLQISPTNAKQFLVDSKTFVDRDVGGGEKAALEVIGRLKEIMEHIYKISSKPAHTGLEKRGLKFEMNPDREDALFVFESSLCILRYFIEKFKKLS
jgi:hypothetical protein